MNIRRLLWAIWIVVCVLLGMQLASRKACAAETVRASFYGSESGNRTANGERFNPQGMTAAHRRLPFGTRLRVCLHGCVVVRINDRGPFIRGRTLDLSAGAARAIGLTRYGVASVSMERM